MQSFYHPDKLKNNLRKSLETNIFLLSKIESPKGNKHLVVVFLPPNDKRIVEISKSVISSVEIKKNVIIKTFKEKTAIVDYPPAGIIIVSATLTTGVTQILTPGYLYPDGGEVNFNNILKFAQKLSTKS